MHTVKKNKAIRENRYFIRVYKCIKLCIVGSV